MIFVEPASELGESRRLEISRVFTAAFSEDFRGLSKNPETLALAFAHALVLERFWVTLIDDAVACVATLTENGQSPLHHDPPTFRKHLGQVRGRIASHVFTSWFEKIRTDLPEGEVEIGFVGTAPGFRRRGAAAALISHIVQLPGYDSFVLEDIKDTNTTALGLYQRLGFTEYKRTSARFGRLGGYRSLVSYRLA